MSGENKGSDRILQEGYIKKGGLNNTPMTPRPAPPQGLSPKPSTSEKK